MSHQGRRSPELTSVGAEVENNVNISHLTGLISFHMRSGDTEGRPDRFNYIREKLKAWLIICRLTAMLLYHMLMAPHERAPCMKPPPFIVSCLPTPPTAT